MILMLQTLFHHTCVAVSHCDINKSDIGICMEGVQLEYNIDNEDGA